MNRWVLASLWFFILISSELPAQNLQVRYDRLKSFSAAHGAGGLSVLKQAHEALNAGSYQFVGIEDLWATTLKEGRTLFSSPHLWGATLAAQTGDMLGQTTIGPWQITTANAREYGSSYGIKNEWSDREVASYLESQPLLQARIAADFIEASYKDLGRRSPLAIQRYFWLEAFQQKKIGQGPWYASVLAKSPADMPRTGFYAKQLLLGSRYNPEGLLYWLYRSGDESAVRETLQLWKESGYPITTEDLNHCSCDPQFRDFVSSRLPLDNAPDHTAVHS